MGGGEKRPLLFQSSIEKLHALNVTLRESFYIFSAARFEENGMGGEKRADTSQLLTLSR